MIRAVAFVGGLLLAASFAHATPVSDAVDHIVVPVSRLARAAAFYTGALSFVAGDPEASAGLVLHLAAARRSNLSNAPAAPFLPTRAATTFGFSIWRSSSRTSTRPTPPCGTPAPCRFQDSRSFYRRGTRTPAASTPSISAA